jgi:hypothetical protein
MKRRGWIPDPEKFHKKREQIKIEPYKEVGG